MRAKNDFILNKIAISLTHFDAFKSEKRVGLDCVYELFKASLLLLLHIHFLFICLNNLFHEIGEPKPHSHSISFSSFASISR